MTNFWQQLNKPIFCLAPMEEVTDVVFREMFAMYSGNHETGNIKKEAGGNNFVMFTEFINVDGLTHPKGRKNLEIDLKYTENQRPIVAQLWGRSPEKFKDAAGVIADLGFDGIDINMGCPQDKEIGQGACAALIREPKLAREIIAATIKGAQKCNPSPALASKGEGDYHLPVSVKTRLGYSKSDEMGDWVKNLLETDIAALILHGRTKQEKSKVPANWQAIAHAVVIRDKMQEKRDKDKTLIIGNGDIKSRAEGLARVKETGADGVMVGRGAFGNPWIFRAVNHQPTIKERLSVMLEHARLFNELLGSYKSFIIMRKHFKAYCSGFEGAHELRVKLLNAKDLNQTKEITEGYLRDIDRY